MTNKLDLDVSMPNSVADVLRAAADRFGADAMMLSANWQDDSAGRVWNRIARVLDRAAIRCEQIVNQEQPGK
jgi:hypothetical protein